MLWTATEAECTWDHYQHLAPDREVDSIQDSSQETAGENQSDCCSFIVTQMLFSVVVLCSLVEVYYNYNCIGEVRNAPETGEGQMVGLLIMMFTFETFATILQRF